MSSIRKFLRLFRKDVVPQFHISTQDHYVIKRKINFYKGEYELAHLKNKYEDDLILIYRLLTFYLKINTSLYCSAIPIVVLLLSNKTPFIIISLQIGLPLYGFFLLVYMNLKSNVIKKISLLEKGNKVKIEFMLFRRKMIVNTTDLSLMDENNYTNVYTENRIPFLINFNPILIKNKIYLIDETTEIYDRELFCMIFKGKNILFEETEVDDIEISKIIQLKTKDNTNYYGF